MKIVTTTQVWYYPIENMPRASDTLELLLVVNNGFRGIIGAGFYKHGANGLGFYDFNNNYINKDNVIFWSYPMIPMTDEEEERKARILANAKLLEEIIDECRRIGPDTLHEPYTI